MSDTLKRNMKLFPSKGLLVLTAVAGLLFPKASKAQDHVDTLSTLSVTGYIDAYYGYYTDSVGPGNYQKFPTVSPRSNSAGLNIAQVAVQYTGQKFRAMGAFHYGDMANSTWPTPYNNIQEAHVGVKIYSKLWIDAGFFRTHFGTESLMPIENITSSVSVSTYYEPYYESGLRLNFDPTPKLEINLYLLNGYGMFIDNNNKKSMGLATTYAISDHVGIGVTNYTGDDSPLGSVTNHLRIHNNAFLNYNNKKIKVQVGGDYSVQQNSDIATGKKYASMYSGLATIRYQCCSQFGIYARGEVFSDPDGYISGIITDRKAKATGYKLMGYTLGGEFKPTPESYIKLEGRYLQMDKDQYIYTYNSAPQNNRFEVNVNAGITFDLLRKVTTRIIHDDADAQEVN